MIKKILIVMIVVPLFLILIGIVSLWVVLARPTLLINETTLGMMARHLAPLGVQVTWKQVDVQAKTHGLLEKTLSFSFENLCVRVNPTLQKACFTKADLSGRYRFERLVPSIVAIGPIALEGGDIDVHIPADERKAKKDVEGRVPLASFTMPELIHRAQIFPIAMAIDRFEIHHGDTTYGGAAELAGEPDDAHHLAHVKVKGHVEELNAGRALDIELELASATGFAKDDWHLTAAATAELGSDGSADVEAELAMNEGLVLDHTIKASYRKDELTADATLEGMLAEKELKTTIAGQVRNVPGMSDAVTAIDLPACTITHTSKSVRDNDGALSFSCHVDFMLKKFKLQPELARIYQPPDRAGLTITADLATFFMPQMDHPTSGTVDILIDPSTGKLVKTLGSVTAKVSGVPDAPPSSWKVDAHMDIHFLIDEFAKVVQVMAATKWPVPAPFNRLDGTLEFSFEGDVSNVANIGRFPLKLATRLRSPDQVIDVDSEGKLELAFAADDNRAHLEMDVTLNDVQLQLPNIAMAGIPRFTPDKRIILNPAPPKKTKKKDMPFYYKVHVTTPENKPARVLSNVTPKYIPIALDVELDNEGIWGTVEITTFPIKLFSREATLDRMTFDFQEPMEASTVDGSLSFEFAELVAIVVIRGPLSRPRITLESKPPMSEGDILASILYGRLMDTIDSDEAESVNNMNIAIADRAMALTSFFLLGTTPIQSISYNPNTGVFAANVKLGKETSLVVGSGGGEKQVLVRHRLGKGFSISAGGEKIDDDSSMGGTAYIEWSKRF